MITGGEGSPGPTRARPYVGAAGVPSTAALPQTTADPAGAEIPSGAASSQTPIFEQTMAFRGTSEFHRTSAFPSAPGPWPTAEPPATGEPPEPAIFPGASDVYGTTQPVEAVWSPAAPDAPGIFADPSGRRRIRLRWLAAGAGLLLSGFLAVAAIGLFGGPTAPLLPWTRPRAEPVPGSPLATQHHHSPAHRGALRAPPGPTPRILAGSHAPRAPRSSATAPGSTSSTAPTSAPSQHTPPGLAHKPSPGPTKLHP